MAIVHLSIGLENAIRDTAITVTVSSEFPTCPKAMLADDDPAKPWMTTGAASEWIKFDYNSMNDPGMFAINNPDASKDLTITRQEHATDDFTSPTINTALSVPLDLFYTGTAGRIANTFGFLFSNSTLRFKRYLFADTGSSRLKFGIIYLGPVVTFDRNVSYGWVDEYVDDSEYIRAISGQKHTRPRKKKRIFRFSFDLATLDDRQAARKLAKFGVGRPTFVMLSPNANTQREHATLTIYGRFTLLPTLEEVFHRGGANNNAFAPTNIECEFEEIV